MFEMLGGRRKKQTQRRTRDNTKRVQRMEVDQSATGARRRRIVSQNIRKLASILEPPRNTAMVDVFSEGSTSITIAGKNILATRDVGGSYMNSAFLKSQWSGKFTTNLYWATRAFKKQQLFRKLRNY